MENIFDEINSSNIQQKEQPSQSTWLIQTGPLNINTYSRFLGFF